MVALVAVAVAVAVVVVLVAVAAVALAALGRLFRDAPMTSVDQLRRVQWAVRATLVLGVAASVTANILHARSHPVAQAIAAWPPLALLIVVELVSRVPLHRRSLGAVRIVATSGIAGIAAFVSYWHMVGVAARYGEVGIAPYLLPLSVDGLIIVASVSLAELAGRIRNITEPSSFTYGDLNSVTHGDLHNARQLSTRINGAVQEDISADTPEDIPNLDSDLAKLLPAARMIRDELVRQGHTVSRDRLAAHLRRDGHAIRNTRVSELIAILKAESSTSPN